jgi:hypothetical protein
MMSLKEGPLMTPKEPENRFTLRIPADLYHRLREEAVRNFRSINSEIECRLRESLKKEKS